MVDRVKQFYLGNGMKYSCQNYILFHKFLAFLKTNEKAKSRQQRHLSAEAGNSCISHDVCFIFKHHHYRF